MPKYKVSYLGLHKKDSYEGLIDYLENKQEKIKYPDRNAKFVRESPQYQQLLSQGFVELEEQQLKQLKEEQEEHAVIRTSHDTTETAKEVRVVASQTDKPLIVKTQSSGTQVQPETTSSYAQSPPVVMKSASNQSNNTVMKTTGSGSPRVVMKSAASNTTEMYDLNVMDNMSKVKQEIESVEASQEQNRRQQDERINKIVENHYSMR